VGERERACGHGAAATEGERTVQSYSPGGSNVDSYRGHGAAATEGARPRHRAQRAHRLRVLTAHCRAVQETQAASCDRQTDRQTDR